jgi:inner membrane transporter RhtA
MVKPTAAVDRLPVELLFVFGAFSQYVGASIAVKLFSQVSPLGVAWLRIVGAALALLAFNRGIGGSWKRADLKLAVILGMATAVMNGMFFLAIDRLPLGKGVAIEFIGPITVAALRTRSRRNAVALGLAAIGVLVLSGGEISAEPLGLFFLLCASAMWAAYIVMGSRVARLDRGTAGLGVGLGMASLILVPIGLPSAWSAFMSWSLVAKGLVVGVFSNAIGYGLDQFVMRRMTTRRFAVMSAFLPATAVLVGMVGLGERPTPLDYVGIALVLSGILVQDRN